MGRAFYGCGEINTYVSLCLLTLYGFVVLYVMANEILTGSFQGQKDLTTVSFHVDFQ